MNSILQPCNESDVKLSQVTSSVRLSLPEKNCVQEDVDMKPWLCNLLVPVSLNVVEASASSSVLSRGYWVGAGLVSEVAAATGPCPP